ncbi:nascent polypeptide-associated complex protein [Candidatus Micrarchaeota archaeon]|nr:nascent polypeptide-associated complex protein [Candidatus Micrarchaeota archaeon]
MHGMNPKQMAQLMKQMGIQSIDIDAKKVIIETEGKNIVIENPSVTEINMKGQKSYQIAGDVKTEENIPDEDVKLVMEQANVSKDKAIETLKETNGDIAEAITILQN